MKKKKTVLVVLTCLLFISLFLISMTYAKYISSVDIADEARVAIWNIDMPTEIDLFKSSYYIDEEEKEGEYVKSLTGSKVVAPGTQGMYQFKIEGKTETNYKLHIGIDRENSYDSIGRDPDDYDDVGRMIYYLIYNNKDGDEVVRRCVNLEDLATKIERLFAEDKVYAAGTSPTVDGNDIFTIKWEWLYEDVDENGNVKTGQDLIDADAIDTSLGQSAIIEKNGGVNESEEYKAQPRVKLTVNITAEQTKEAATQN